MGFLLPKTSSIHDLDELPNVTVRSATGPPGPEERPKHHRRQVVPTRRKEAQRMAGQAVLGFIGSYIIASLLLYPFASHLSTPVQVVIALALAVAGAGLRVRWWKGRQQRTTL